MRRATDSTVLELYRTHLHILLYYIICDFRKHAQTWNASQAIEHSAMFAGIGAFCIGSCCCCCCRSYSIFAIPNYSVWSKCTHLEYMEVP